MDGQVVFILPDGSAADPGHSVIRVRPDIPEGLCKKVRERIIKAFKDAVSMV
jgi:hypothetical protein